jgi:hypothetical protein
MIKECRLFHGNKEDHTLQYVLYDETDEKGKLARFADNRNKFAIASFSIAFTTE